MIQHASRIAPIRFVASLIALAPMSLYGVTMGTGQNFLESVDARGKVIDASADYVIVQLDGSSRRRVWDVNRQVLIDLRDPVGSYNGISSYYLSAVDGNTIAGTTGGQGYVWTLNNGQVNGGALPTAIDPEVYGISGSIVVGQSYAVQDYLPYATYWDASGSHILATAAQQSYQSSAQAVSGNKVAGWVSNTLGNIHYATAWQITGSGTDALTTRLSSSPSEAVAVSGNLYGGYVVNSSDNHQATVWRCDQVGTSNVTEINLNPNNYNGITSGVSDVADVASGVLIDGVVYDIAVGTILIDSDDGQSSTFHAVLWLLTGNEADPFEMIQLDVSENIRDSYATSIVLQDGELAAIYGYGARVDDEGNSEGNMALVWYADGFGPAVPEPATACMMMLGAGALLMRHRKS